MGVKICCIILRKYYQAMNNREGSFEENFLRVISKHASNVPRNKGKQEVIKI